MGALAAMLLAGALFTCWAAARADGGMRQELLQQAHLVSHTVDVAHVRLLTGTETDLTSPEYLWLKEQFAAIKAGNDKYRFVYLLGRPAHDTILVLVDNEPASSAGYSPPGDHFPEATEGHHRVFDTGTEVVAGPFTDRWGTWISALIPVHDPHSHELLAVLGVDVDARDWTWSVAAQTALPTGLLLILLIGLAAVLFASGRASSSPKPVMRRLLPTMTVLLILLIGGGYWLFIDANENRLREISLTTKEHAMGDLEQLLAEQARGLAAVQVPLLRDPELIAALKAGQRERLLAHSQPLFEALNAHHDVTHFYFSDARRVCLLRVHAPERHGDRFHRFTALEAERIGEVASGIELGPLGTFTLRVVRPVFENGELLGYLELGKEIEDVLERIVAFEEVEKMLLVRKTELDRSQWEAGMRMLGRQAHWDRLPDHAIIYASIPLPAEAERLVGRSVHDRSDASDEIRFDDRYWRVTVEPATDASGRDVGEFLLLHDVTELKAAQQRQVMAAGAAALVLLALLLALAVVILHRTDAGIRAQQAALWEREEHLSTMLRSMGDGVIACDGEGRVTCACQPPTTGKRWTGGGGGAEMSSWRGAGS
jgi:PAS domain-containing protein